MALVLLIHDTASCPFDGHYTDESRREMKDDKNQKRKIIHVDMDCFFAAIEVRDHPYLAGKPVAVGGSPTGRGVVTTCTYEARKYGVRSAMSSAHALRLCPDLIFVQSHFDKYKEASQQIRDIFLEFTDTIEPLSLDEAFLDVSDNQEFNGSATLLAEEIRRRIKEKTELNSSAGIAPNKFLAKVASDWKKPNGQFTIAPDKVNAFVKTLPIEKIPGVGKVTAKKMHERGIKTCADLQNFELHDLTRIYGKWGKRLYNVCRGIDHRPVQVSRIRKSLSVERTYSKDLQKTEECLEKVPYLFEEFTRRWEKIKKDYLIKGLFVKVKFDDFSTTTLERKEFNLPSVTAFRTLLKEALQRESKAVRLLGVGVRLNSKNPERKKTSSQMDLF